MYIEQICIERELGQSTFWGGLNVNCKWIGVIILSQSFGTQAHSMSCVPESWTESTTSLSVREHFNIDQFKGYKVDTILMGGSWNVEEIALITNWGQENIQSWSIGLIYCSNSHRLLCMARSSN